MVLFIITYVFNSGVWAFGFGKIVFVGADIWFYLCWMNILFLGFCCPCWFLRGVEAVCCLAVNYSTILIVVATGNYRYSVSLGIGSWHLGTGIDYDSGFSGSTGGRKAECYTGICLGSWKWGQSERLKQVAICRSGQGTGRLGLEERIETKICSSPTYFCDQGLVCSFSSFLPCFLSFYVSFFFLPFIHFVNTYAYNALN